ncbi:HAD-IIIC family phosphatase [Saccharopolyspora shandongensis]|uniref:HAD-IIIC family phosphatase n=1 Tax=Saccharopolyspora shandongensis TaxID=418495 RepID=UPI0033DDB06C
MTDRTPPVPVKCLVWDLDNTLWQGTLLEGDEVRVPDGVRDVLAMLDSRGILQSVASKNDHDMAWQKLAQLGVAEYFVLPEIGWGPKSDSVRRIADQLRFAHTTIAFIDDSPAEHAEVTFHLPEVRCYSPEQLLDLSVLPEFAPATVTEDSRQRRRMYQANFRREAAQAAFTGPDEDFLRSLDLVMRIARAEQEDLARVEELTLRTSQMNATGVHYSDAELRDLCEDSSHDVLVISMADRFGPHGAVGVLLLARNAEFWHLKLLATSCRVVSFGAGAVILNWLITQAHAAGVHLVADFRPTDRNRMMEIAYRFAGFTTDPCACLAASGLPPNADIQRMHLVPDRRNEPGTMRLITEDLSAT